VNESREMSPGTLKACVFALTLVGVDAHLARAVCGDLNSSGTVSSTDALVCLQGTVGVVSLDDTCEPEPGCSAGDPPCGDVNGDGAATATDCLMILGAGVGTVDLTGGCACEVRDLCAGVTPVAGTNVKSELFVDGLHKPVYVTAPPGDTRRVLIVQQNGLVRLVLDGALQPQPFLDISDRVQFYDCCEEEGGLLSIAFDPDYATNGRVFAYYTEIFGGDAVIARFEKLPGLDRLDEANEKVLFYVAQDDPYHNGGQLQFGPDRHLWVGTGDGNGNFGGDPAGHAQRDGDLLGKMLRVDVDVNVPPYWAVPSDNPATLPHLSSLVWAKGLRNPWRFSFDRATGDLYIGDVGQDNREEIDFVAAGSNGGINFGWNVFEGTRCFAGSSCPNPSAFRAPIYEYSHTGNGGASVTGGYVYRGCAMPDLRGTYFFGDYARGTIHSFVVSNGNAGTVTNRTAALDPSGPRTIRLISSFGEDARGEMYVADYLDGEVYRIVPN
jgi:glucose/arabinose dehydrogenase